jgi:uncharacterized RDD family membrane protein YckC
MPEAMAPDPPGFYMGWPLASLAKRCASGILDYGVFFFVAVVIASVLAAVVRAIAGENAGAAASLLLVGAAYCASLYNFSVLQSRTGQTWGKGLVGVRAVDMVQLTPPGKLILGFKPFFSVMEIIFGVGLVAIMFSRHRQSLSDKFCGIVVIDERKAGLTLPWVLPGQPVMQMAAPQPQGGVPRPERTRRWGRPGAETATAEDQPIDPFADPDEHPVLTPEPDDDVDLPKVEFSDEPLRPHTDQPAVRDEDDLPEPEVEVPIPRQAATAETAVRDEDDFPEPELVDPIGSTVVSAPPPAASGPVNAPDDDLPEVDVEDAIGSRVVTAPATQPLPEPTGPVVDDGAAAHGDEEPARPATPATPPEATAERKAEGDDAQRPDLPPLPPLLEDRRVFTDSGIAMAIRTGDINLAHERARKNIDACFERDGVVDIVQAVEEYRALIRHQGRAIRADDDTIARWLGLA